MKEKFKLELDQYEGVYERISSSGNNTPRYKLGVIKSDNEYTLIYLGGAAFEDDWQHGEVKAKMIKKAQMTQNAGKYLQKL